MGLFSEKCPSCGDKIKKGLNFCPNCGEPSPSARTKCQYCGASVAAAGSFCSACGKELYAMDRPELVGNQWARREGDFAVRFGDQDITGLLTKGLIVEHGTRALLFQRGRYLGELPSGRYDMGGLLKRINTFNRAVPSSVVLIDEGDIDIVVMAENFFTKDNLTVGLKCGLAMQIYDPEMFFVNMFKGKRKITIEEVERSLKEEIAAIMKATVALYLVKELYGNVSLRREMEEKLRLEMSTTLSRFGLQIVQLRILDFTGEAFEKIKHRRGELFVGEEGVDIAAKRAELNQRLRGTLTQEKVDSFKSEKEFERFVRQCEHEMGVKEIIQEDEMLRLKEKFQASRDREALLREIEKEGISAEARRNGAVKDAISAETVEEVKHRAELERRKGQFDQDMREAESGVEILRKMKAAKREDESERLKMEREHEREQLKLRSEATAEALISILDGPKAERIVEIEKLRAKEKMTPEQILAVVAEASPEAARTLGEKYRAEAQISEHRLKDLEARLAEQREIMDRYADRLERVTERAMQEMGKVAESRARGGKVQPTIVTSGGLGGPVVVGGEASAAPKKVVNCSKCGCENEAASRFCQECGTKL